MNNIDKAKSLLSEGGYTCVLTNGETVLVSKERGVKPLLEFIEQGENLSGFAAADKVVGKAAALLYAYMNLQAVYARVLSVSAQEVFRRCGISAEYETLAEKIINRNGDGICPMELAVADTDDPEEGLKLIKAKFMRLNKR